MGLLPLLIALLIPLARAQDRKIESKLNPGCNSSCTKSTLLYIRAEGPHDTIHQIWDFTLHLPTIIYSVASVNSTLSLEWNRDTVRRFNFSETPSYSFAAVILSIYEYNDLDDFGFIDPKSDLYSHPLKHVMWERNFTSLSGDETKVIMKTKDWSLGTLEIKLDLLPFKDFAKELPHLVHTSNTTLIDVSMVNFTTLHKYNSSRFALYMTLVSTDSPEDSMHCTVRKSLDDEHTPGVFEVIEILTPESYKKGDGGFIQFRPVAYTQQERGVASSSNVHVSPLYGTPLPPRSTVYEFYSQLKPSTLLAQDLYISFGDPGDGFYKQHNYTAWSFTFGYGAPPIEGFSLFVMVIIAIGLGVPILLTLSGVLYVVIRRLKQTRNPPARLVEE